MDQHEKLKIFLLGAAFFFVIAAYTIISVCKQTLFVAMAGIEYEPVARLWAIFILVPALLFYSRLVDVLRRSHLLYVYCAIYAIGSLIIAYFLGDPIIGLSNTVVSHTRIFPWVLYFFFEGCYPFIVSLFWAFLHSVSDANEAKKTYPLLTAWSKIGGCLGGGLAYFIFSRTNPFSSVVQFDVINHQIAMVIIAICFIVIPFIIHLLFKKVPKEYMRGYEAVRQVEKEKEEHHTKSNFFKEMFSGLRMLIEYPYVMGIFGITFFWEIINMFVKFARLLEARSMTLSEQSAYLLKQDIIVHIVVIMTILLGTRAIVEWLGERYSLLLVPIITSITLACYFSAQSPEVLFIVYLIIRTTNYALAQPLRESLYIPTTKAVKFKSKSWIDAFGGKIAKGTGAGYNRIYAHLSSAARLPVNGVFFGVVMILWLFVSNNLGKRFETVIAKNDVIGE
jgi:AAA family ATP:ADP antiporter